MSTEEQPMKSERYMRATVGPEPCLQCDPQMVSFCRDKAPRCPAMEHYIDTGETPERSEIGWVV